MRKLFTLISLFLACSLPIWANDYVALAKVGNIYDDASAKYITVNQENEDIKVIPGMVFATTQHTPGWYKIEYSPGLHAFIPDQIVATSFQPVKPGEYKVLNNPSQNLSVKQNGDEWTAETNGQTYKGIKSEDILVFVNPQNNIMFSLVDFGNGPVVISYDNSLTNFF